MSLDTVLNLARTQTIQLSIAIAMALALTLLLRRRPHLAYAIWIAVLVKAVTPPVWSSPVGIFSWMSTSRNETPARHVEPSDSTSAGAPIEFSVTSSDPAPLPGTITPKAVPTQSSVAAGLPAVRASMDTPPRIERRDVVAAIWAVGALIALVIPLGRLVLLRRRVLEHATAPDERVSALLDRVCMALGIRRPVRLIICADPIGPAVVGVIRPMVVIPRSLAEGSHSALRGALAHELIHLRRRDPLIALLQWIATALWWFHPLVWWMNRRLGIAREASCDEESVAALNCAPDDYAQMLLDVVRFRRRDRSSLFSLGVSPLQINTQRLEHIMNPATHFHRRTPLLAWLLSAALIVLLLPGAGLALQNVIPDKPKPDGANEPAEVMHFSGMVIDAQTKKPLEGATVVVHRFSYGNDDSNTRLAEDTTLTTGADGKFAFDVPPEQQDPAKRLYLELDFRHPKYASLIGHGYGLGLIKKDLALGNQPWFSKTELQPGEEISGTLVNFDGKPAADVPITFSSIGGPYDRRFISDQRVDDKTETDENGKFRFNAIQGAGLTFLWAKPDDRAILFHGVRDQRGDIGTFRLEEGISIPGQVLTYDGKPVANVGVRLESVEKNDVQNEIASRYTSTDAEGKFTFKPVAPGAYEIHVSNMIWDESTGTRTMVKLPGAFAKQIVVAEYKDYNKFPPVQIKALESVALKLQYIDGTGKPRKGHGVHLFGQLDGNNYQLDAKPDNHGLIEAFVPRGVSEARISLTTDPYSSLRWKRGQDGELNPIDLKSAGVEIPLGTLDKHVTDLFIVRYDAPTLIVKAVDEAGNAIESARPGVFYPGERPTTRNFWFRNGVTGDVGFEKQDDGTWRSNQLLPDVKFMLRVDAEGFDSKSEEISMKEKETRTVTVKLAKSK